MTNDQIKLTIFAAYTLGCLFIDMYGKRGLTTEAGRERTKHVGWYWFFISLLILCVS